MRLVVLVLAVLARWSVAAPVNDVQLPATGDSAAAPDTAEQDLMKLSAKSKQVPPENKEEYPSAGEDNEYGFDPRTLEIIEALVSQAEEVAEREFAAELVDAVLYRRQQLALQEQQKQHEQGQEEQQQQQPEEQVQKVEERVPHPKSQDVGSSFLSQGNIPEVGKIQEDQNSVVEAESKPVKELLSERFKSLMSHLPYPLTARELQPRTRRRRQA